MMAKNEGSNEGKIEIAKKMISNKEPIEKICEYTDLSIEKINNIIDI